MLGQNIKETRRARGMRREELAYKSGLSLATVSKLEQGRYEPRIDTLRKLAAVLGVSVSRLLDESTAEFDPTRISRDQLTEDAPTVAPRQGIYPV